MTRRLNLWRRTVEQQFGGAGGVVQWKRPLAAVVGMTGAKEVRTPTYREDVSDGDVLLEFKRV